MTDSKGRLVAREPLCLFLVTSASWRLRGVKRPQQRSNGEQPQGEPWPANARGSLSVKGNEAKPRVIRQNENPVRACDVGAPRAGPREPSFGQRDITRAPLRKLMGVPKGSSRNVRHEQPIRHALLEMPDHGRLGSWDRDCQRLASGRSELNDVGAVILRPSDAQVFGCHHPNIATTRHEQKINMWTPIIIQYRIGAASL